MWTSGRGAIQPRSLTQPSPLPSYTLTTRSFFLIDANIRRNYIYNPRVLWDKKARANQLPSTNEKLASVLSGGAKI